MPDSPSSDLLLSNEALEEGGLSVYWGVGERSISDSVWKLTPESPTFGLGKPGSLHLWLVLIIPPVEITVRPFMCISPEAAATAEEVNSGWFAALLNLLHWLHRSMKAKFRVCFFLGWGKS